MKETERMRECEREREGREGKGRGGKEVSGSSDPTCHSSV